MEKQTKQLVWIGVIVLVIFLGGMFTQKKLPLFTIYNPPGQECFRTNAYSITSLSSLADKDKYVSLNVEGNEELEAFSGLSRKRSTNRDCDYLAGEYGWGEVIRSYTSLKFYYNPGLPRLVISNSNTITAGGCEYVYLYREDGITDVAPCSAGQTTCVPDCFGKTCGSDGCGGSCNPPTSTCTGACVNGQCNGEDTCFPGVQRCVNLETSQSCLSTLRWSGYLPCETNSVCMNSQCEPITNFICLPDWNCGEWGTCQSGLKHRTCTDNNACDTTAGKPTEQQSCTTACVENWNCGEWSTCSSNYIQTRTCTDLNGCGTVKDKPSLQKGCSQVIDDTTDTTTDTDKDTDTFDFSTFLSDNMLIIALVAGGILLIVLFKKK